MKKIFQYIGLISVMCLSFFYTEKTVDVVKEYDDIYISILDYSEKFNSKYEDAIIDNNTIIPGLSGLKVNISESYNKMKRYGKYNESLIVLDKYKPSIRLEKNKNKYIISGNKSKNMISILFILDNDLHVDYILDVLKNKKINADFIVNNELLEKSLLKIISNNNSVGIGNKDLFYSYNNYLKNNKNVKKVYCYNEEKDDNYLNMCSNSGDYTINTNIILKNNLVSNVKKILNDGSIISIYINDLNKNELPILINYILSKGYDIKKLEEHLEE